jgi:hypothetical protein
MNKVRAGFFSFTEILNGEHRSYNEWHQLDHMPEQFPIPGIAYGQRWVQSPRCREARLVAEPLLAPVHYMTLYLMTEPLERTLDEFRHLGAELATMGRWHHHRHAHFSGALMRLHSYASPRVRVSGESIPYRPTRGIFVSVQEVTDPGALEPFLAWEEGHIHRALAVPGVAGIWTFASHPVVSERRNPLPFPMRINVLYLDDDPVETTGRLVEFGAEDRWTGHPAVRHVLVAPFETVIPWQWDWFDKEG